MTNPIQTKLALSPEVVHTSEPTRIETFWGARILDEGFTSIPNILVRNYRALGIEHGEWGLICTLLSYKHDNRDPFPEQETLSRHLGVSVRQIRKWTDSLVAKGLLRVGRRRHNRTKQYGALVYNLLPLINHALELVGDQPLSASVDDFDVEYTSRHPAVPEVPVGQDEPAVLHVPVAFLTGKPRRDAENSIFLPAVLEVPHKRVIKKTNKTTTTKTTCARTNPNFRIERQTSHTKESIVQQIQEKIATHLPQHKSTDVTSQPSHVTTDSVPSESLSHSVCDWDVPRDLSSPPSIPFFQDTEKPSQNNRVSESFMTPYPFVALQDQNFLARGSVTTNLNTDMTRNPYAELEFYMQRNLGRPYIAKENDYRAMKELLTSGVPLDWILSGVDRVFEMRDDSKKRIHGFAYVAEVLKDEWAKELVKSEENVQPIDFKKRMQNGQRDISSSSTIKTRRPTTDSYTAVMERDPRYEAFYRLFPND